MEPSINAQRRFLWIKSVGKEDIPEGSPIHHLHECWASYCKDGVLPSRQDIDPVELGAAVLPWIVLLEVLSDGKELDYRYRLLGTGNVRLLGLDRTGQLLDEALEPADVETIKPSFDAVVTTRAPVFTLSGLPHKEEFLVSVYRAFYPLASDGVNVDMVIGAAIPEDISQ